jgi:hypothetical protein
MTLDVPKPTLCENNADDKTGTWLTTKTSELGLIDRDSVKLKQGL